MNIGYEDDDLKPYVEPSADNSDHIRIGNSRVGAFLCQCCKFLYLLPHQENLIHEWEGWVHFMGNLRFLLD